MENAIGEILVVPFFGQGHVLPLSELCKKLSSFYFKTTFILSSDIAPSISSSLAQHPLLNVTDVDAPIPPPPRPEIKFDPQPIMMYYKQMRQGVESYCKNNYNNNVTKNNKLKIFCAIVDIMILPYFKDVFTKFQVPIVAFSPFSAASLAMDYAAWKADVEFIKPGETRILPGLPEEMGMDYGDVVRRYYNSSEEPLIGTKKKSFPTQPGDEPVWVQEVKVTSAILVNTYDVLEHTFLEYLAKQTRLPIYAIGLVPEKFWSLTSTKSLIHDKDIRKINNSSQKSNYSEDEVLNWLNTKSPNSVIYISFGSELLPTLQEHEEISKALIELSSQNFIWVISKNQDYYPRDLENEVGNRGLVIHGWAPQLLIFSHPSTGGCLFHCGWNSTMEAIGRGIPLLAWPIRGDNFYNAKSIVCHLKIGYMVSSNGENIGLKKVKKDEIIQGIKRLMEDKQVHNRVKELSEKFRNANYLVGSIANLHDFKDFIMQSK
ncbi:hypothetical protein EJD97_001186 [Solanum chilense]|uniref:Glycosyltransferase n=1 Tax=Solanum chilense TaxID=4083 RepID=A0A6N2C5J4_SOLCI|nr:hypothetical protein EJD97_001186 [Solanum chilense]